LSTVTEICLEDRRTVSRAASPRWLAGVAIRWDRT
jgi:hypothetical protein